MNHDRVVASAKTAHQMSVTQPQLDTNQQHHVDHLIVMTVTNHQAVIVVHLVIALNQLTRRVVALAKTGRVLVAVQLAAHHLVAHAHHQAVVLVVVTAAAAAIVQVLVQSRNLTLQTLLKKLKSKLLLRSTYRSTALRTF